MHDKTITPQDGDMDPDFTVGLRGYLSRLALTRPDGTLAAHGVIQWQGAENETGGLTG